jgi:hypothetical protein
MIALTSGFGTVSAMVKLDGDRRREAPGLNSLFTNTEK